MLIYALLEVSIKKWLTPPGDTAAIPNSLRGLGLMGIHTLLWMWYVCDTVEYVNNYVTLQHFNCYNK